MGCSVLKNLSMENTQLLLLHVPPSLGYVILVATVTDVNLQKKYETSKRLFELIRNCECRNSWGICCVSCEECRGADCESMIYASQQEP